MLCSISINILSHITAYDDLWPTLNYKIVFMLRTMHNVP